MTSRDSIPVVYLKPGEVDRILTGHPWVYEGCIARMTRVPADGEEVHVKDQRQRHLGSGFFNSQSRIRVRLLNRDKAPLDEAFFDGRLRASLALRKRELPGATSFRVVNAESDSLSGLIVDKYEDVLVLQTSSLAMDQRKPMIVEILRRLLSPRAIVERNDMASRKFEGLPMSEGLLFGALDGEVAVQLGGLKYSVHLAGGHKTGLYLDQQVNHQLVARYAQGRQVLDCFAFMGGFGLQAARNGASRVHMLDQSQECLDAARKNAELNGLGDRCSFESANVFDWLKGRTKVGPHETLVPQFDLIILDPPSFTRSRATIPDALRGYKEIHLRAMKLLKPGGILATFCCSHHVDAYTFQDAILAAATDARRMLRRVATYTQSPDHPIIPAIPETEYLKGFAFEFAW